MTARVDKAGEMFAQGFNCAQSLFAAFAEEAGVDVDQALRIASPFGGGIGRTGEVCGAASGALMVLGAVRGPCQAGRDKKARAYEMARDFLGRFRAAEGAVTCNGLLGCDISTPEGLADATERKAFAAVCPKAVCSAAAIVEQMLAEQ